MNAADAAPLAELGPGIADRSRRAALTSASMLAANVAAVGSALVSVPLALGYLGAERYGLLVAVISVSSLVALADFGVGNAIVNPLTDARARGGYVRAARVTTAAALMTLGLILLLVAAGVAAYPHLHWDALLNVVGTSAAGEAAPAIATATVLAAATVVMALAQYIRRAHQEAQVNSAFSVAGSMGSVGALAVVTRADLGLPGVVVAMLGVPLLAASANAAMLLVTERAWLRPSISRETVSAGRQLLTSGFWFFLYQTGLAIAWTSQDAFITSRVSGVREAADYAIAAKLFLVPTTLILAFLMPLWPAYRDALARGEIGWVTDTLVRSLRRTVVFMVPASALIVLAGQVVVALWLGPAVEIATGLLIGAAVFAVGSAISTALQVLIVALGHVRFLVVTTMATAASHVAFSVVLGSAFGAAGVAWGTAISTLLFMLVPHALFVRGLFHGWASRGPGAGRP